MSEISEETRAALKRLRESVMRQREQGEHDLRSVLFDIDCELKGEPIEADDEA